MRRRSLLLAPASAFAVRAQTRAEILDLITPLASGLSDGDPGLFMKQISPAMPDYSKLRDSVYALTQQFVATSSIELIRHQDGEAELDWYMQIVSRETEAIVDRRREAVSVRVGKDGKIVSISPIGFFAPPKVR
ncbi:MAG: hypothetical protein ACRD7E_07990 [Bryobacteraceae bacterium]